MMKKKGIILILMMLIGWTSILAQEKGKNRKELRVAFLTEELSISDKEGAEFWPLYEAYTKDKRTTNKAIKAIRIQVKENANLSENEFIQSTDDISDLKIKSINFNKQFLKDCLPILGVERTVKFIESEKKFKKKMHEQRDKKQ